MQLCKKHKIPLIYIKTCHIFYLLLTTESNSVGIKQLIDIHVSLQFCLPDWQHVPPVVLQYV